MKKPNIPMFDILRCIAIICIIFAHIDSYISLDFFDYGDYFALIGLTIFFFISGFFFQYNNKIKSKKDIILSVKKRAKRIYPLFWLSILITIILDALHLNIFPLDIKIIDLLIDVLGLQGLFPMFTVPYALWYIGVILIFYLISYFLIYCAKNVKQIVVYSTVIFLVICLARYEFKIINVNVFQYYFVFIAGFIIGFICNSKNINNENIKYISITSLFFIFGMFSIYLLTRSMMRNEGITKSYINKYGILNILNTSVFKSVFIYDIIIFFVLIISTLIIYKKCYNISNLKIVASREVYSKVAYSSYAVYLFHIQILSLIKKILDMILFEGMIKDYLMFILGIPIVFVVGYQIQKHFDQI